MGRTAIYLVACAVVCVFYEIALRDTLANTVMEYTFNSFTMQESEVEDYLLATGTMAWDLEIGQPDENGAVQVRDLTAYHRIRSLKWPIALTLFFLGYMVLVRSVLAWSVRYFEELSGAVSGLMTDRETPVRLSRPLALTQGELNELREQSLTNERAAADAERRKNELVAYLAHDIRTPLTSVVGYLSLLDEAPDLPEAQRQKYVSTALAKAETLDSLTTEFFEITRYNLSSIPIERDEVEVQLFLEQLASDFLPELQGRGLAVRVDAPPCKTMFADGGKMARAVGNVIRNAIAYASAGTEIVLEAREQQGGGWQICVRDQGREIAPEHLKSIFERFFRADDARASTGSAGLGLAIAREIVQAHGGTIRAESKDGLTTFIIELP